MTLKDKLDKILAIEERVDGLRMEIEVLERDKYRFQKEIFGLGDGDKIDTQKLVAGVANVVGLLHKEV